jgi:hypothetical protein
VDVPRVHPAGVHTGCVPPGARSGELPFGGSVRGAVRGAAPRIRLTGSCGTGSGTGLRDVHTAANDHMGPDFARHFPGLPGVLLPGDTAPAS